MHFRLRTNAIQLIRTTYDAQTKRGKSEVVGTVPRRSMTLSDEIAGKLSAEEKAGFEAFVAGYKNTAVLQAKVHAFQIVDIVNQAISAAEASEGIEQDLILANLSDASQTLRKFLHRQHQA